MLKSLISLLLIFCSALGYGQAQDYDSDVKSISSIVNTLYDVISGKPGEARDWARFKNLFKPESRLLPTGKNKSDQYTVRSISPDEYVELFSNNISTGFFEKELHQEIEEYGTIVHVFSTYETTEKINGPATNRGINSIQLFKDNNRYYIISIFWCAESMGFKLPAKYLN